MSQKAPLSVPVTFELTMQKVARRPSHWLGGWAKRKVLPTRHKVPTTITQFRLGLVIFTILRGEDKDE